MSDDVLDPYRLAVMTPYSSAAWTRALGYARDDGIPDSAIVSLVNGGAWPGLIAAFPMARKAMVPLVEKITQLTELVKPYLPPSAPTDVRGRALWLRQHRNTGPDHGHPGWKP